MGEGAMADAAATLRGRGWLAPLAEHRKALSASLATQLVSSATNFALAAVLVRTLPPSGYGAYAIGMSACYLYAGFGNALLLTQMVVQAPEKAAWERQAYMARVLAAVLGACAVTAAVAVAGAAAAGALGHVSGGTVSVAAASGIAAACYLLKDYFVRQAYVARAEPRALVITCAVAVALAVGLGASWRFQTRLSASQALGLFAGAQLAGAAVGACRARLPLRAVRWRPMLADVSESWAQARWAMLGVLVTWAQSQAYAYATALAMGAAAVGRANAARLLVSPFLILVPAVSQVTMPRLADLRVQDEARMIRLGRRATIGLTGLGALYALLVVAFADLAAAILLGSRYRDVRPLVAAWGFVLVAMLVRDGAATLLIAMKRFRSLTVANAATAAISLAAVIGATRAWGPTGAVVATGGGELLLGVACWRICRTSERAEAHHVARLAR